MAKGKKIVVEGKEYILSFPTRKDAENAEKTGFSLFKMQEEPLNQIGKLFRGALLWKKPSMSEYEAIKIMDKYQEEGGDIRDINEFLIEQYSNFFNVQAGAKDKIKAEEVDI